MAISRELQKKLQQELVALMEQVRKMYVDELEAQGHNNTGRLMRTARVEGKLIPLGARSDLILQDYYIFLEKKLSPRNVPFRRGSGARSSKLIQALTRYFIRKGLPRNQARSAAFATAIVWKREGRPTRGSRRFSRTGKRTEPLSRVISRLQSRVEKQFEEAGQGLFEFLATEMVNQSRATINS